MNLLRHPYWGRAQETYGEDPYHIGRLASAMVSNGNIIGNFQTKESADLERAQNTAEAWPNGYLWQCVVKVRSRATQAEVGMSLLVGYYDTLADAEAEGTTGSPWPQEY